MFEDTSGKRGAWEIWSRLKKSTDTFGIDGHVIGISSPKTANGIIMSLYRDGKREKNAKTYFYETWKMNPNMTEEGLREEYKYDMGTFYRDFACRPETAGGLEFPEGLRSVPMINLLQSNFRPKDPRMRVLAIDPAVTNDSFGMACGYMDYTAGVVVDGVTKFTRQGDEPYIRASDIWKFIQEAVPRLNISAVVFDTWMYPDVIEKLQLKFGIVAEKHIVEKEDYDRWKGMQGENPETPVIVVEDVDLKREVENLVVIRGAKKSRVDHPFNGSKDAADCVANVIWYLKEREMPNMSLGIVGVRVI